MDLAKVGEVESYSNDVDYVRRHHAVNERLKEGWLLLSVKIVELREPTTGGKQRTDAKVVYIIGRPRDQKAVVYGAEHQKWLRETLEFTAQVSAKAGVPYPYGMEMEEAEAWLKEHIPAGGPKHPGHQCEGRNEPPGQ